MYSMYAECYLYSLLHAATVLTIKETYCRMMRVLSFLLINHQKRVLY